MRVCIIGAIVVAIGVCPTVFAGDPNLLQTFVKPPPRNFARFGESTTSEDGDVLISGELCHAAYLYSGSTGELLKTIPSPQPNLDDSFGFSSAYANGITYISAGHNSDKQQNSGCVYVYEPLTNIPIRTLYAPKPTDGGGFGFALAARGDKLLVGNFSETVIAPVYEFDSLGNVLLSLQNPGSSQKNHFGGSVAFVGDKIAVGAPGFSRTGGVVGAVYIFNSTTGELERTL